ncbi:hypothetical protein ACIBBG_31925 [Micromonospora chersina]|uniref:hypothetical protein n=1 Tax=Micromonospora chersina TaxID=47854 RepID=UPI003791C1CC
MVTPDVPETPQVPADTRLSLRAGEWATHLGQLGTVYLDLRTVDVGGQSEGLDGWVWVRAHTPECRWESVACARDWCVKVAVRAEALYDAANR